jgi:hypothetical protein
MITNVLQGQLTGYQAQMKSLKQSRRTTLDSLKQLDENEVNTKLAQQLHRSVKIQLADIDIQIERLQGKIDLLKRHLEGRGEPWSLCSIA